MRVERQLQICVAGMAVLGSVFLGLGKADPVYPLAMCLVAATSLFFTDRMGFGLGRPIAGAATLVFLVYSFSNISGREDQNRLETITNLLIFLQVMLLYLEKRDSIYWLLIVLSLLEVVVAAAMNVGVEFGLLLVVFLSLMFVTLTVFYVFRETDGFRLESKDESIGSPSKSADGSATASTIELMVPAARVVCPAFIRQIVAVCAISVMFAIFAFYAMRRVPNMSWNNALGSGHSTVGFAPTVSLDEMGQVLQSNEVAMRIAFIDARTQSPYLLNEEPYIRGLVLSRYGSRDIPGTWLPSETHQVARLPAATTMNGVVQQNIWLAPTSDNTMFSVSPAVALPDSPRDFWLDMVNGRVLRVAARDATTSGQPYYYSIGTRGLRGGRSLQVVPGDRFLEDAQTRPDEIRTRQYQERFPNLQRIAEKAIRDARVEGWDWYQQARVLESHFHVPGRYHYTLDFDFPRDESLDPIEDFIANHHSGHCEYFASALTLMLRTQGIPSRLVVGYHGGEYNELGKYFQIRQSDAHAWVEAYMRPQDLVAMGLENISDYPKGGWLRLDPTPAGTDAIAARDDDSIISRFSSAFDYAQFLWNDYVLGFNAKTPKAAAKELTGDDLADYLLPSLHVDAIAHSLVQSWKAAEGSVWAQIWRAVVVLLISTAAVWPVLRFVRRWLLDHPEWRGTALRVFGIRATRDRIVPGKSIAFFHEFEQVMRQQGWLRKPEETPWEFQRNLVDALRARDPDLVGNCQQIVDTFYQVRFGKGTLDKHQTQAIEQQVTDLRQRLLGSAAIRTQGTA